MNSYAIILDNVIINVVVWDGETEFSVDEGDLVQLEADSPIGIGWFYSEGNWYPPINNEEE